MRPLSPPATSASASSTGARGDHEQAHEHFTTATTKYREMEMLFCWSSRRRR